MDLHLPIKSSRASDGKVMASVFWDSGGVIMIDNFKTDTFCSAEL